MPNETNRGEARVKYIDLFGDPHALLRRLTAEPPTLASDEAAPVRRRLRAVTMPADPDGLLTAHQAAARLGITTEQLIAHVKDGGLRCINVGRGKKKLRRRFDPAEIEKFKADRTITEQPCPSSSRKNPRPITGLASSANVVGFTARRAAHLAAKLKGSKR